MLAATLVREAATFAALVRGPAQAIDTLQRGGAARLIDTATSQTTQRAAETAALTALATSASRTTGANRRYLVRGSRLSSTGRRR